MKIEKYEYSTIGEICSRMNWGKKKALRMIQFEGFPAVKIGREYMTTEPKIREWIDNKISCQ
jgi:hypothetical protein